ncbi:hypothetical protein CARUB_v10006480mg [Capsella rubella]|uniref:RING-type domain-containing protein n=1 Tax=Capsella rubella TaxID=81985 RepID=R0F836_9BRAS|nr:hypothetical protein CARUB_v10006480mg [Capsella rubella]
MISQCGLLYFILFNLYLLVDLCIQPATTESVPDVETGHLTPSESELKIFKTGYTSRIKGMESKEEEEGFGGDEICCCSICLEEFEDGHEIVSINKCRHVFHRLCIDSWLKQDQSCPNCRCFLLDFIYT